MVFYIITVFKTISQIHTENAVKSHETTGYLSPVAIGSATVSPL
jgi:hypothetical protein